MVSTVNAYIQRNKEERQRDLERARDGQPQEERKDELLIPMGVHSAQEKISEVERLLVQNIVRHGHEIIFPGLEAEDGSTIDLNVAQYIGYDLGQDGLQFSNELYNQILQEAVEHATDEGFQADRYFMQHPDPQISQLAASLGIDRHQLSESFKKEYTTADLQQKIQHLILDFRMDIVNQRLKEIQRQLKTMGSQIDREQLKQLMDEYKDTQELRNALAKQRGSDVIV
jgi:DNA primase